MGRPKKQENNEVLFVNEKILTVEEAAKIIKLKPRTIEERIRNGELKAHKVSDRKSMPWLILYSDLLKYVKED